MPESELTRLEEIERSAHARFLRLSGYGGITDRALIQAAKDLWDEAAAAVRVHKAAVSKS
jgi:hypothetical protein